MGRSECFLSLLRRLNVAAESGQLCYWIGIDPSSAWVECTLKEYGGKTREGGQGKGDLVPSWGSELGCVAGRHSRISEDVLGWVHGVCCLQMDGQQPFLGWLKVPSSSQGGARPVKEWARWSWRVGF